MGNALDTGKSMAEGILAKLPENLRDGFRASLLAPEATDALTELGARALAQSDYSKKMDEMKEKEEALTADYERLNTWYGTAEAKLKAYDTILPEYTALKGGKPPADPPKPPVAAAGMTREELDKALAERDQSYASVLALTTTLTARHLQMFAEAPDMQQVIATATQKRLPLQEAYNSLYGERITAKHKEAEDARIQKIVDEKVAEARKGFTADQPFPLRHQSPSVLDVLDTPDGAKKHTVETAVSAYESLAAARG